MKNELADAVSRAEPSVVQIKGRPRIPSTGIVWSKDTIVTASHTLHSDDAVDIIGRDPSTDVAVVRVKETSVPITIADEVPRVGNIVLALGRPGRSVRAAFGMVSAVGDRHIEVDGTLPAGFSGGPLIDADGKCIGMNTSRLMRGGTTIPASTLTRIVEEIVAHGSIHRPFLGVAVYPVESGLLIMSVKGGSAAEKAGLLVGDIIIHESPRTLRDVLDDLTAGSEAKLRITRGGESKELRVTL